ncbi:MAG: hypothetical protein OIF40_07430, partial [Mangrovicoccus sp.]|nr:hypothetical protein [Mangrovicoccus sp.]
LDSIKLIQHITNGTLGQIAIGRGENIRSAFFPMPALAKALPLVAHHCSWTAGAGAPSDNSL